MKQYEMYFTNEYTVEIIDELMDIFGVSYDKRLLQCAIEEMDNNSINNLFILNMTKGCLIVDCNNKDWIYSLIVISDDAYADMVINTMFKWDNEIREEYGQEINLCMQDVYGKNNTLLESIENYYGIKYYR